MINLLFKSRLKKLLVVSIFMGFLAAFFFGGAAWNHNPMDEFHFDGAATADFYFLIGISFGLVTGAIIIVGTLVIYFTSKS